MFSPPEPSRPPCPPWCRDRGRPDAHHSGPHSTYHWGHQMQVTIPRPLSPSEAVLLRAELYRADEDGRSDTGLYVAGETDIDLTPAETPGFIQQMQSFVHTLWIWQQRMPA